MPRLITSLAELLELLSDDHDHDHGPGEDSLCFCGTKQDAVDAAFKLMGQMHEHDCILWAMQVAAAAHVISLAVSAKVANSALMYDTMRMKMTETITDNGPNVERLKEFLAKIPVRD